MTGAELSRRAFLKAAGTAAGAAWLAAQWPAVWAAAGEAAKARDSAARFKALNAGEAAGFAAIAAQIFPTDELPGANEAGVVHFIDVALATFMAGAADGLRAGLKALDGRAGGSFAKLPPEAQTKLLKAEEASPFFQVVLFLTVAGMFALPQYGGNRDGAGWKVLGFESRHVWAPPFGHYDAQAMKPAGKP